MDNRKDQAEPTMEEILASIRRIISEDSEDEAKADAKVQEQDDGQKPEGGPPEEPAQEKQAPDDIFELTQIADEPDTQSIDIPKSAPDDLAVPEPEPEDEAPPEPAPETASSRFEPKSEFEAEPTSAEEKRPTDEDAIISSGPAAATTAAFAGLLGALDHPTRTSGDMPIGNSGLTLEELVRQMVRPMLREWLDANLPGLVERLVKREIERMVRRAED